ncbi:hypothetical protein LQW54_000246 [Pestalotiopsis sp. IQ-011]
MAEGMPFEEAHADEIGLAAYEARAGKQALVTQTTATNEPTSEYDVPRYIGKGGQIVLTTTFKHRYLGWPQGVVEAVLTLNTGKLDNTIIR